MSVEQGHVAEGGTFGRIHMRPNHLYHDWVSIDFFLSCKLLSSSSYNLVV